MNKENKTVVITGGSRGLGYELAKQFLQRNYNVVICGTREETINAALKSLSEEIGTGHSAGKVCDVSSLEEVEALADYAEEQFGSIDIWINNAGVNQSYRYYWEIPESELDCLINIDLKGAINGTQVATRRMIKQNSGAIYNVEGMGSNDAFQSCLSMYGTTKRAVTYFTDAAAHEIEDRKLPIIIGKLSPGIMLTEFLTSVGNQVDCAELNDKTKKVYSILGDYPDVIAKFLVDGIENNRKNGQRIAWLTGAKAASKFIRYGIKNLCNNARPINSKE